MTSEEFVRQAYAIDEVKDIGDVFRLENGRIQRFDLGSCVEACSGYPLQCGGMRRHCWQDELAAELGHAVAVMSFRAGESLAGT